MNFENGQLRAEVDHSTTVSGLKMQIDEFRKTLKSENELAEVLRKWENKNLRVSDPEFKLVEEFINTIAEKTLKLEWSFVSDYEPQPPRW